MSEMGQNATWREGQLLAQSGRSLRCVGYDKQYGLARSVRGFFRAVATVSAFFRVRLTRTISRALPRTAAVGLKRSRRCLFQQFRSSLISGVDRSHRDDRRPFLPDIFVRVLALRKFHFLLRSDRARINPVAFPSTEVAPAPCGQLASPAPASRRSGASKQNVRLAAAWRSSFLSP
jgi:hypothetical protein